MTQVSRLAVTENGQQKIYLLHKPVIDDGNLYTGSDVKMRLKLELKRP